MTGTGLDPQPFLKNSYRKIPAHRIILAGINGVHGGFVKTKKKKRTRILLKVAGWVLATVFLLLLVIRFWVIDWMGGAYTKKPGAIDKELSADALKLVQQAFEGIEPSKMLDYHVHILGLGTHDSGCFVHPHMLSWLHPLKRIKFLAYTGAGAIIDFDKADFQYAERLVSLIRRNTIAKSSEGAEYGKVLALAFDKYYDHSGEPVLARTEFYVPNQYVFELHKTYPDVFIPTCSVHPYRKDALDELRKCAQNGIKIIKWLPNAMGINPADDKCAPFYAVMKEHGMILLSHTGDEKAVEAKEDQALGNPLLLRKPLDMGTKVIIAHCASLGTNIDLDSPTKELKNNFDFFLRMMDEKKYEGLLFGDISSILQFNRLPDPVIGLLKRSDLHHRLVNGSDYPLPAVNIVVWTDKLAEHGLIQDEQVDLLNQIYDYNPLTFDFVTKRSLRLPGTDQGFAASVFIQHLDLLSFSL
jgi:predicted TIM-barrel fold metal-dependent hydrolase